eukprot:718046-Ditylum_brightwellii.AAC.1
MGMGMVLATAEMLKNDDVRQKEETTGTNYNKAILALKEVIPNLSKIAEQRKKVPEVLKQMNQNIGVMELWCGVMQ